MDMLVSVCIVSSWVYGWCLYWVIMGDWLVFVLSHNGYVG